MRTISLPSHIYPIRDNRIRAISRMKPSMRAIIQQIETVWSLDSNTQKYLDRYYLQCWTGESLESAIHSSNDCSIMHQGVKYHVVWCECTPTAAYDSTAVLLSFRQLNHIFQYPNIVLVRVKD